MLVVVVMVLVAVVVMVLIVRAGGCHVGGCISKGVVRGYDKVAGRGCDDTLLEWRDAADSDWLSPLLHAANAALVSRKKASNSRYICPEAAARMHQITMPGRQRREGKDGVIIRVIS